IYTAGQGGISTMEDYLDRTEVYAYNQLSLMVPKGNPKNIQALADLERPDVRISMPNPAWEGIGRQIESSYRKAGGEDLYEAIMARKVDDGSTYLTRIHHRESPLRILLGDADVAPVWTSEVAYQRSIGHPVEEVVIPAEQNSRATYVAGKLKKAPHPE